VFGAAYAVYSSKVNSEKKLITFGKKNNFKNIPKVLIIYFK